MKIALIHDNQLILGPMKFNYKMINSELEDLQIPDRTNIDDYLRLPIHFSDGLTHLLPIQEIIPSYIERHQYVGNFNWEVLKNNDIPFKVNFTYPIIDKTLDQVKEEIKRKLIPQRRKKENNLIKININGTEIEVSTSREERMILTSKIMSSPGPYNYKFNNIWLNITKQELEYICNLIDTKVQEAFDWEYSKIQEIDSCITINDVYNVEIY